MSPSEPEISQPWRPAWKEAGWVLLMFAASRLVVVALIVFSRQIVERGPHVVVSKQTEHGGTLLDILTQWDGVWYRLIASQGYGPPTPEVAAAWFPVYPLLVRAVEFVVRDFQVASLLVSNGCLIAAAWLLVRLLRLDYDELICRRVITFLMFNPVSFFLSSAYTESTFLLLSIGALLAARQGKVARRRAFGDVLVGDSRSRPNDWGALIYGVYPGVVEGRRYCASIFSSALTPPGLSAGRTCRLPVLFLCAAW